MPPVERAAVEHAVGEENRRFRPRLTLATLLLLITAIAAAMAWNRTHQQLVQTRSAVTSMRWLARELRIEDPEKIAAIARVPTLPGELILDVYIPPTLKGEPSHQLCLVLEGIMGRGFIGDRFPDPLKTSPLFAGQHSVELRHLKPDSSDPAAEHDIEVLVDGMVVMQDSRPANWQPADGWTSLGTITESQSFDADQAVELHRLRFNRKTPSGSVSVDRDQPTNGLLLWIAPSG